MRSKEYYSSGAPWESIAGYSRAVRVGNVIEVAGTTAVREGMLVGKDDATLQTHTILTIIEEALRGLGSTMADVVRTRMYVTDISRWEEFAKAHGDVFGESRPVTTMVEVSALIDPDMLIEIEATAIIHS